MMMLLAKTIIRFKLNWLTIIENFCEDQNVDQTLDALNSLPSSASASSAQTVFWGKFGEDKVAFKMSSLCYLFRQVQHNKLCLF